MAEPVSWAAIAAVCVDVVGVLGTIGTIIGAIASFFNAGAVFLFFFFKIVTTIIVNVSYALFMAVLLPFQGIFGFLFYTANDWIAEAQADRFEDAPIAPPENPVTFIQVISTAVETIRDVIIDFITFSSVLFTILPTLIAISIIIVALAALTIPFTVPFFVIVDAIWKLYSAWLEGTIIFLNAAIDGIYIIAPLNNAIWDLIFDIVPILFGVVCPNPLTGSLEADCPILWSIYLIIKTGFDAIFTLIVLFWNLLIEAIISLGEFVCPAGICPSSICLEVLGISTCEWTLTNPRFIINYIFYVFRLILIKVVQILFINLYFTLDIARSILFYFQSSLGQYINSTALLNLYAATTNYQPLSTFVVSPDLVPLKNLNLFFEDFISVLLQIFSSLVGTGFALFEMLFCNVIREPLHCGGGKICDLLFRDFTFYFGLIPYFVAINKIICTDLLHISKDICLQTCDRCGFKPFGISLDISWWYAANLKYLSDVSAGYSFAPCVIGTSCCVISSSIMQFLLP